MLLCGPRPAYAEVQTAPAYLNAAPACTLPAKRMARVELIFGAGSIVTPRAWNNFLSREVTPRFPDGLSVFEGRGQWRGKNGVITREASRLLLIWFEPDGASDAKIEAIRSAYKQRFHQDSVLRADEASCISF